MVGKVGISPTLAKAQIKEHVKSPAKPPEKSKPIAKSPIKLPSKTKDKSKAKSKAKHIINDEENDDDDESLVIEDSSDEDSEYDSDRAPHRKAATPSKRSKRKPNYRKVLMNSAEGISQAAILRIAHKAGVKTVGSQMYIETREILRQFLETLFKEAVTYTEQGRRKTVSRDDVLHAAEQRGRKIYTSGKEGETKRCPMYKPVANASKKVTVEKERPMKRGELAQQEILFYQKQRECLQISR
jgi:histone H4